MRLGADALSDVELMALLLGTGRRGAGVLDCAQDLLMTFGGLTGLAEQDAGTLAAVPGVGPAKATRIVAALAVARRFGTSTDRRRTIRTPADVARVARPLLAGATDDRLVVVAGDRTCRVLGAVVVPTVRAHDPTPPVREVLAETLRRGGMTLALAHRHDADPGCPAGDALTRAVEEAAAHCGLRLLDHVVLTGQAPTPERASAPSGETPHRPARRRRSGRETSGGDACHDEGGRAAGVAGEAGGTG